MGKKKQYRKAYQRGINKGTVAQRLEEAFERGYQKGLVARKKRG